jgi:hypothetical protein
MCVCTYQKYPGVMCLRIFICWLSTAGACPSLLTTSGRLRSRRLKERRGGRGVHRRRSGLLIHALPTAAAAAATMHEDAGRIRAPEKVYGVQNVLHVQTVVCVLLDGLGEIDVFDSIHVYFPQPSNLDGQFIISAAIIEFDVCM